MCAPDLGGHGAASEADGHQQSHTEVSTAEGCLPGAWREAEAGGLAGERGADPGRLRRGTRPGPQILASGEDTGSR